MHTPPFWYQKNRTLRAQLLRPVSWLYGAGAWLWRQLAPQAKVAAPMICVGNCVAGGAGKTPVVMALTRLLRAKGLQPHIVSRGYGGALYGPVRVDSALHRAFDVGDEPLLLAREAPVWVAKNRVAGAVAAIMEGAALLLLDDGFQNHSLRKDINLLVVDGVTGFGNGLLLPAGPLREPWRAALGRADAVIFIGPAAPLYDTLAAFKPIFRADMSTICAAHDLRGRRVFAFAGLAHPDKFFAGLAQLGASVVGTRAFPDHHVWRTSELAALLDTARTADALPVVTAKDAARLPDDIKSKVTVCDAVLAWDDEAAFEAFLDASLQK